MAAGVRCGSRSCIHPRAGVKFLHTSHTSTAALQHLHPADSCLQMLPWLRLLHEKACASLSCHSTAPVLAQYHHIMNVTITAALGQHFSPCRCCTPSHHHTLHIPPALPCSVSKQFAASVGRTVSTGMRHEVTSEPEPRTYAAW